MTSRLLLVALAVFLINLPFGLWRSRARKYSWPWILAIHLPVPLIIALRLYSGIGFHAITYAVVAGAFFLGQFSGGQAGKRLAAGEK